MNLFVIKVCLYKFQEYCQLVPNEVCNDIVKEYPSLTIANECQYIPRQTCSEDDVKPKEVIKPVIKKVMSYLLTTCVHEKLTTNFHEILTNKINLVHLSSDRFSFFYVKSG